MLWTWVSTIFCRYLIYQQHFIPLTIIFILLQWLSKTFGCETISLCLNSISRIIHNLCILLLNPQLSYVWCSNGSVLGPLLLTMHTAEVGEIICGHRLPHHSYADDVYILGVCILDGRELLKTNVLARIKSADKWMTSNRLKLNPTMTNFMWCATSRRLHVFQDSALHAFNLRDCSVEDVRH